MPKPPMLEGGCDMSVRPRPSPTTCNKWHEHSGSDQEEEEGGHGWTATRTVTKALGRGVEEEGVRTDGRRHGRRIVGFRTQGLAGP